MLQVFHIVNFVTVEDNLVTMLDFDADAFFETIVGLFIGKPWLFITKRGEFKFNFEKQEQIESDAKVEAICNIPVADKILSIFKIAAERSTLKSSDQTKEAFKELLLTIVVEQNKQLVGKYKKLERIVLNYDVVFLSIKSLFKSNFIKERDIVEEGSWTNFVDESLIFNSLKAITLKEEHIDEIIALAKNA